SNSEIPGKVVLTTKTDKDIQQVTYKFYLRHTTGEGEKRKTNDITLGESTYKEPFTLKPGETKTLDFKIPYSLSKGLEDMGGVLGGIGKVASFLSTDRKEFYVLATASVKGTAFGPYDQKQVQIVT